MLQILTKHFFTSTKTKQDWTDMYYSINGHNYTTSLSEFMLNILMYFSYSDYYVEIDCNVLQDIHIALQFRDSTVVGSLSTFGNK